MTKVDSMLERLRSGLSANGLLDCVNVMVVSDHGMANSGPSFAVKLTDYLAHPLLDANVYNGAFARIDPRDKSDGEFLTSTVVFFFMRYI